MDLLVEGFNVLGFQFQYWMLPAILVAAPAIVISRRTR